MLLAGVDSPAFRSADVSENVLMAVLSMMASTTDMDTSPDIHALFEKCGGFSPRVLIVTRFEPDSGQISEGSILLTSNQELNVAMLSQWTEARNLSMFYVKKKEPGVWELIGYK